MEGRPLWGAAATLMNPVPLAGRAHTPPLGRASGSTAESNRCPAFGVGPVVKTKPETSVAERRNVERRRQLLITSHARRLGHSPVPRLCRTPFSRAASGLSW